MTEAGTRAAPFTLPGIDGRHYSLPQDSQDCPTLLVFFKSTCGTCDLAFPYINRLKDTYPEGWRLWAIAQDPPETAREYARRHGIGYPVLVDAPAYQVSKAYDPPATPALVLIDAAGAVAYATHGFAKDDLNELSRRIAAYTGAEARIVAPPDDGNPSFRPG